MLAWPTDQINQTTEAQAAKVQLLQSAAAQAAEIVKAACPTEAPSTPPARLAAVGYRVQAMLEAVQTVEPPREISTPYSTTSNKLGSTHLARRLLRRLGDRGLDPIAGSWMGGRRLFRAGPRDYGYYAVVVGHSIRVISFDPKTCAPFVKPLN